MRTGVLHPKVLLLLCCFTLLALIVLKIISNSNFSNWSPVEPRLHFPSLNVLHYTNSKKDWTINNRIFFHETTGANFLTQKQLCVVESAALHNPQHEIQLFLHTSREPNLCSSWTEVIRRYSNIQVVLVNESTYFNDSPLQDWYQSLKSEFRTSNMSAFWMAEFASILNSYRYGGTYLDLDIMIVAPLQKELNTNEYNFVVFEDEKETKLLSHAYRMSPNHPLTIDIMNRMVHHFKPFYNGSHLSDAINAAIKKKCSILFEDVLAESSQPVRCDDVLLLPYWSFYPLDRYIGSINYLFGIITNDDEMFKDIKGSSIGVHFWDSLSRGYPMLFKQNYTLTLLAKQNCPLTVSTALNFV